MKATFWKEKLIGTISPMIYGQFIEHFHRQIYGGIYDPGNPLSGEDGLRTDVLEAMRKIKVPVLRWPGGCFVSSYHWKDAVGEKRIPFFDKAWRVEDTNEFGTDEYIRMCRKIGCEPYICTNAGTGTVEEMSDWVEYCNLKQEGQYAKWRIQNGQEKPYQVKYWSIGNENYGLWEIGAKNPVEWGSLVTEAAKMMKHVDPDIELSAAALADIDWNVNLLKNSGVFLSWVSIHDYWDQVRETNDFAPYDICMSYTNTIESSVKKVKGLLAAMGLDKIKIAFDEWNLRQWYHPLAHTIEQGRTKVEYLYPRDDNDINSMYTMADAVFAGCFLNMCGRNCDVVGMANYAPVVNTRGCIYTYEDGIVLRSTYYVFELYVHYLGNIALDGWQDEVEQMQVRTSDHNTCWTSVLDILPTYDTENHQYAVAVVNKDPKEEKELEIAALDQNVREYRILTVNGTSTESYNDIGHTEVTLKKGLWKKNVDNKYRFEPHSVNILQLR